MFDTHVHSSFSADGKQAAEDYCKAALNKGLSYICLTEHIDLKHPENEFTLDYQSYLKEMTRLKGLYNSATFQVGMGLEAAYLPQSIDETIGAAKLLPYDMIIWSVHAVDGHDAYEGAYFENKPKSVAYGRYLEEIYRSLCAYNGYQTVGHIGYVARRAPYADPSLRYADFPDLFDAILKKIIKDDKALELNTGGLRMNRPLMPEQDILSRYYDLGGRKVTYGSDAHQAVYLHYGFDLVVKALKDLGFTHLTYYIKQKPIMTPLEELV